MTHAKSNNRCCICGGQIDADDIADLFEEYSDILVQADALGVESLTEDEQLVYERTIHAGCYTLHFIEQGA